MREDGARITAARLSDSGGRGHGPPVGLTVERHRVQDFESPELCTDEHVVCLHVGRPQRLRWRTSEGRVGTKVMRRGDATLAPAGAPRAVRSEGGSEILLASLDGALVAEAARDLGLEFREGFPDWTARHDPRLLYLGLALEADAGTDAPGGLGGALYAEAVARAIAVHLVQGYRTTGSRDRKEPDRASGGLPPRLLSLVTDYVGDNLGGDLSLGRIAEEAGMSPYHFARSFKRSTGRTLHGYVVERRLGLAKKWLAGTDLPVGDISRRIGLSSQSHFSRAFRERVGTTPMAYREGFQNSHHGRPGGTDRSFS